MVNYYRKTTLLKTRGPQILLGVFMFWPITLKQLKSLTWQSIRSVVSVVYTTRIWLREVPVSIPLSGRDLYVVVFFCCCCYCCCCCCLVVVVVAAAAAAAGVTMLRPLMLILLACLLLFVCFFYLLRRATCQL